MIHPDIDVTEEYAIDELVARACEDMLSNSKAAQELLEQLPENERKTLYEKFKEALENLKKWIGELLGQYSAKSQEARILREYEDKLKALQDTWDKAFKAAVTANQALQRDGVIQGESVQFSDGDSDLNEFGLSKYTEKEIENWINSNILYANSEQDIIEYVENHVRTGENTRLYCGKIFGNLAERIKKDTGYDLEGYNVSITSSFENSHADGEAEALSGQIAMSPSEVAKFPYVISNYDTVDFGGFSKENNPVLKFEKSINGKKIAVTYILTKRRMLKLHTIYGWAEKKNHLTATNAPMDDASARTSGANSDTDSNNNISNSSEGVNTKKDIRQYTYGGRDAFNVDTESFTNALIMRNQGVSEEEVFEKTGWFLGTDKKWRFEIDDSEAEMFYRGDAKLADNPLYKEYMELFVEIFNWGEYDKNKVERYRELDEIFKEIKKNRTVEDYMKHDMLFDAYPFLRYIGVERVKMRDEYLGAYKPSENVIKVNQKRFKENSSIMLKKSYYMSYSM